MREKVKKRCLTAVLLLLKSPDVFVHLMGNMRSIMFCIAHLKDFHYCVHSEWPFGQCTKNPPLSPLVCPLENLEYLTRLIVECFLSCFGLGNGMRVWNHTDCAPSHLMPSSHWYRCCEAQKSSYWDDGCGRSEKVEGGGVKALSS